MCDMGVREREVVRGCPNGTHYQQPRGSTDRLWKSQDPVDIYFRAGILAEYKAFKAFCVRSRENFVGAHLRLTGGG